MRLFPWGYANSSVVFAEMKMQKNCKGIIAMEPYINRRYIKIHKLPLPLVAMFN
jgi:hypothetical protein